MLATIFDIPADDKNLDWWGFHNDQAHQQIISAVNLQGASLNPYILYPVNFDDFEGWLDRHAQAHSDMNAVLGYAGSDLQDVNFDDPRELELWLQLHFAEHQNASQVLGVP